MFKVKIITVGKNKESWLSQALDEYTKRMKNLLEIEWSLLKDSVELKKHLLEKEKDFIALDLLGKHFTSEEFSTYFTTILKEKGSRLSFVIGAAEGLDDEIRAKAKGLICLSKMTLTHQMCRLLLVEQIYRALEIDKGSGYHK